MEAPDYSKRCDRLRKLIKQADAKGILITSFVNVTYLTGFTGDDSYFLVTGDGETLISDPRYEEQIGEECPGLNVFIRKPSVPILPASIDLCKKSRLASLLVEGDCMTIGQYETLKSQLDGTAIGTSSGLVESLRQIKDGYEIGKIRRAIEMAERAFVSVRCGLRGSQTERDIANDLDRIIRQLGGKGSAFSTIVGVGDRAALPHGVPSDKRLEESPFVLIDWGAKEGLYLSDLTRVLVTSRIPPKFERLYNAVLDAHKAAAAALRPGAILGDIDQIARASLEKAGLEKKFTHGLGHGFGLQIHETPRMGKNQVGKLEAGMVVTIEPGVYLPGWGGIRIEDDYQIHSDGSEKLTSLSRDLEDNIVHLL